MFPKINYPSLSEVDMQLESTRSRQERKMQAAAGKEIKIVIKIPGISRIEIRSVRVPLDRMKPFLC